MEVNAVVLECDQSAAKTFVKEIESSSKIKCAIAVSIEEAKKLLKTSDIRYFFCSTEISSNDESEREDKMVDYISRDYPDILFFSIGSMNIEDVIISEKKLFLFNRHSFKDECRNLQSNDKQMA